MSREYLFADSERAAQRLEYLSGVFAETTRDFLAAVDIDRPALVLDLGCGPGYTTHFLAQLTRCRRAVGLDNSASFIALAEQTQTDSVTFQLHDITEVPFPAGLSDLLYCRFLLAHLQDPAGTIDRWGTQLRQGGRLLIEEVETELKALRESENGTDRHEWGMRQLAFRRI